MQAADPPSEADGGTPLLFARVLDGRGGGREVDWDTARAWTPVHPGELLWVHLCRHCTGVTEWLENGLSIPRTTAELLTSDATRPRAFREGGALVATLRGINFNPGAEPEDMVSMQLWCDGARLVTLRRLPLQTPRDTLAEIDAGQGPTDAGSLVTSLTEHMLDGISRVIIDINEQIDEIEERYPGSIEAGEASSRIAAIRRDCLALKRHMGPQHVALGAISRDAPGWFEDHDRREMAESIERLGRYLADIDVSKESAVVLMDELRSRALAATERTNRRLTLVATVFLPLSFFVGLFGINVGGMPWAELAGDQRGFWIVAGTSTAIAAAILLLFRRWKWL